MKLCHIHLCGPERHLAAWELLAPRTEEPFLWLLEDENGPAGPHTEAQVGLVGVFEPTRQLRLPVTINNELWMRRVWEVLERLEEEGLQFYGFIHPVTGNELKDHLDWVAFGPKDVSLDYSYFRGEYREGIAKAVGAHYPKYASQLARFPAGSALTVRGMYVPPEWETTLGDHYLEPEEKIQPKKKRRKKL